MKILGKDMSEPNLKKPLLVTLLQIIAVLLILGHVSTAARVLQETYDLPVVIGTFIVTLVVLIASIWILKGLSSKRFKSKTPVSLFMWLVILIYPIMNVMKTSGYYLPDSYIPDEQLLGAAVYELLRILIPIFLVLWVGLSKKLKAYLAMEKP